MSAAEKLVMEESVTVNKIGGVNTSHPDEILNLVKVLKKQGEAPVLVVSAFGKDEKKGEKEGITNELIAALGKLNKIDYDEKTIEAEITEAFKTVMEITNRRIDDFIKTEPFKKQAQEHVQKEMDICIEILKTHKKVMKTLDPDEKTYTTRDKIIAFGERSVIGILEAYLKENGIDAKAINDVEYKGNGEKASKSELHKGIQKGIAESLNPYKDKIGEQVLIIGGHVKNVLRGMVKEIGRSYTDTTAVDVTVALEKILGVSVDSTVAWKDVDGVMSSAPNQMDKSINPSTGKAINTPIVHGDMSLEEGLEMAGVSTLMQVDALGLALEEEISLSLKNIKKPHEEGTTFHVDEVITDLPFKVVMANKMEDTISCKIPSMAAGPGFAAALTKAFADNNVSINDIITSSTAVNFTINLPPDEADVKELRKRIRKTIIKLKKVEIDSEIYKCRTKWYKQNKANVVVIGDELRNAKGILNVLTGVMSSQGINIEMIEQTEEQRKISFYVNHKDAHKAVQALHRVFIDKDKDFAKGVVAKIEENVERFLSK